MEMEMQMARDALQAIEKQIAEAARAAWAAGAADDLEAVRVNAAKAHKGYKRAQVQHRQICAVMDQTAAVSWSPLVALEVHASYATSREASYSATWARLYYLAPWPPSLKAAENRAAAAAADAKCRRALVAAADDRHSRALAVALGR